MSDLRTARGGARRCVNVGCGVLRSKLKNAAPNCCRGISQKGGKSRHGAMRDDRVRCPRAAVECSRGTAAFDMYIKSCVASVDTGICLYNP